MRLHIILTLICSLLMGFNAMGQKERSLLRKGNKAYENGDFKDAEDYYNESLKVDPSFGKAQYNIGNTFYSIGDLAKAAEKFEIASADAIDKKEKAMAYHNQGNCYLNAGIYLERNPPEPDSTGNTGPDPQALIKKSISAYKNALRNNPGDEEARYNLAYAQKLVKKEGEGGGEGQDQQEQQEQEEEQQQQEEQQQEEQQKNEDGDEKDKQNQEQQPQNQEDEQQGEPEKKEGMTKKEAEQMLDALDKQEKDLQMKKGKERMDGKKIKIDKDW